ncbi:MAG: LacI family transcriptional regulator [Sulfobacillus thermosulfidooxidans]|uniref:LacI family transcriptional regulator n=1 Tax=Sulfobacillus thermosulfidooxidans TaxID=28034 RepID=A0A2T2WRJ3_SULTH|nr:MAG: LacI family transcriptional regulator [Sulfobacillus thermosulfidooxidans]
MKKQVAVLALVGVVGAAALAGCGESANNSNASGSSSPTKPAITIGYVPGDSTDPFFISMEYGAQKEAKKLGVKLIWEGASQYSPSQQTPVVDSLVSRGVSALVVAPTDAKAMIPPIRNAVNSGIPVITADSTIDQTSLLTARVTSNNIQGGEAAAKILAKLIHYKGTVAVLSPAPGISTDAARVQGFEQQIKTYPGIKFVGIQYDQEQNTKAATLAQDLILRYPNLNGIFGTDDTSASGAAVGVRSAGKLGKVKIVGYDAEPQEIQDIQSGLISAVIAQKPMIEGELAVQYAVEAAEHKHNIPKFTELQNIIIDKNNLSQNQQWVYRTTP